MMTKYRDMTTDELTKIVCDLCSGIRNTCGIYLWWRKDHYGVISAYVGQSVHLINRSVSHFKEYDHLGLSLDAHGVYSPENTGGWQLKVWYYERKQLDMAERALIEQTLKKDVRIFNITSGGQGQGKTDIGERKAPKGYYDGIRQGAKSVRTAIAKIANAYLTIAPKKDNKTCAKMYNKFWQLLQDENDNKEQGDDEDYETVETSSQRE